MSKYRLRIKFIKAYDKYHADIYRFLRVKTPSDEMAQDLASEAFTKAWDALNKDGTDYPKNERAYLYKVARNTLIDHYRKHKREVNMEDDDIKLQIDKGERGQYAGEAELALANKEDFARVRAALVKLPEYYADLLTLKYINELSNKEIAEVLDKNEGAVRTGLHRALRKLREKI